MSISEVIQWVKDHPAEVAAIVVAVVQLARIVVKYTSTDRDDTWLAKFIELCKFLGIVIPSDAAVTKALDKAVVKVEAAADVAVAKVEDAAPAASATWTATIPVVRQLDTGEQLAPDAFGARPPAGRRLMRLHVRRTARRHGLADVADWDDEQIDEVLDRADLKAREMSGGILQDLFAWIVSHPEELLAIIKFLLAIFAGDAKAKAGKAAAK